MRAIPERFVSWVCAVGVEDGYDGPREKASEAIDARGLIVNTLRKRSITLGALRGLLFEQFVLAFDLGVLRLEVQGSMRAAPWAD